MDPETATSRIGRYLLYRTIARGGMGEVCRARSYGAAGVVKDLCIKRIRAEYLARSGAVSRFVEEARLSMALSHPNIVSVFDFGRSGEEYYLAMEWVDGADLRRILKDLASRGERLPPHVAADVASTVARALSYAHRHSPHPVVHRDVKPANVLVSRDGDVKLTDFGVATVAGGASTVAGTPAYMAPEQKAGAVDPRTDLYALGAVLYEMLVGAAPHPGADVNTATGVPDELRELIGGMLDPDPDGRPAAARGVAAELEKAVSRARLDGAPSARDVLGEMVSRIADDDAQEAAGELGADASFVRDGTEGDFETLMTQTLQSTVPGVNRRGGGLPLQVSRSVQDHAAQGESAGPSSNPDSVESEVQEASSRERPERSHVADAPVSTLGHGRPRWRSMAIALSAVALVVSAVAYVSLRPSPSSQPSIPSRGLDTESDATASEPTSHDEEALDVGTSGMAEGESTAQPSGEASTGSGAPNVEPDSPARAPDRPQRLQESPRRGGGQQGERPPPTQDPGTAFETAGSGGSPESPPRAPPAVMSINAVPWAEVEIDGRAAGVTPLFDVELPPGRHRLRFRNGPLGADREQVVDLASGQRRSLVVDLR